MVAGMIPRLLVMVVSFDIVCGCVVAVAVDLVLFQANVLFQFDCVHIFALG